MKLSYLPLGAGELPDSFVSILSLRGWAYSTVIAIIRNALDLNANTSSYNTHEPPKKIVHCRSSKHPRRRS